MTGFDELKRWAVDCLMPLGDTELVAGPPPALLAPAVFFKACASLVEAVDRFKTMCGYEDVALCELIRQFRTESLPTLWRCYDLRTLEGELLILRGDPFWMHRDALDLRKMIKEAAKLGATLEGAPLRICGVFTCRQRLDAMCPLTTTGTADSIEHEMMRAIWSRSLPDAKGNYNKPRIPEKILEGKLIQGWADECEARGRLDLIDYLNTGIRNKIRRAAGRMP